MVDGINGNYQNTSLSCVNDECKEIQEEETTINFADDVEEISNEDSVKITDKTESDKDVDKRNFDTEEAHIYAEGEAAIEKEVQARLMTRGIISILWGKNAAELEAEVREKYAKNHPEYAAVMEEGQAVEKAYDKAKTEALAEWEAKNPKPEPPHPIFGSTVQMAAYSIKLKEWQAERAEQEKAFSEEYAKDNPNYANLKEQQDKKPNIIDILTSPVIDPKIVMKDF